MKRIWIENRVIAGSVVILFLLFVPAFLHARAEVRDDLRKQDLANMKGALEQYFNKHNFYAASPTADAACTASNDSASWFFSGAAPLVRERFADVMPHDIRETNNRFYRYCVTNAGQAARGYFLEARLEVREPEGVRFDDDEGRKYHYQVLHEGDAVLYRVCGGDEHLCDPS